MHIQETRVSEIMSSPVIVIRADATVEEAQALMEERGVRRLPVVNEEGHLIGIITEGDLREATAIKATLNPYAPEAAEKWLTVEEAMTPNPITVSQDTPIWQAAEILIEKKIGGLPVVDERKNLCGIITASDILRLVVAKWRQARKEEPLASD